MGKYEEVLVEGRGPRDPRSKGSKVQGSQGPKVPRTKISQTQNSNTSLTLKKVHLVSMIIDLLEVKITEI